MVIRARFSRAGRMARRVRLRRITVVAVAVVAVPVSVAWHVTCVACCMFGSM